MPFIKPNWLKINGSVPYHWSLSPKKLGESSDTTLNTKVFNEDWQHKFPAKSTSQPKFYLLNWWLPVSYKWSHINFVSPTIIKSHHIREQDHTTPPITYQIRTTLTQNPLDLSKSQESLSPSIWKMHKLDIAEAALETSLSLQGQKMFLVPSTTLFLRKFQVRPMMEYYFYIRDSVVIYKHPRLHLSKSYLAWSYSRKILQPLVHRVAIFLFLKSFLLLQ